MSMKDLTVKDLLKSDLERIYTNKKMELNKEGFSLHLIFFKYFLITRSFRAIYCYRILHKRHLNGKRGNNFLEKLSSIINTLVIPYPTEIGPGLFIGNPQCIVINPETKIGRNATILPQVILGGSIGKTKRGRVAPELGDNVLLSAGAKILGPIKIGDNSMIGGNSVVVKDVPENSVVVGVPGKVVKQVTKPYIEIEKEL